MVPFFIVTVEAALRGVDRRYEDAARALGASPGTVLWRITLPSIRWAVVYGAIPNPGLTIDRALSLAEEQAAQNATFGAWWNSETGQLLRQMTDRVQSVNPLLGDEIVFTASVSEVN